MLTWASRRQLAYLFLVVGTLVVLAAYPVYRTFIYHVPSCFDGIKNQDEIGVDCGGSCKAVCSFSVTPLVVEWSRFFKVSDGTYDLAAYVENRNTNAGIARIGYTFELYDANSNLIGTRKGGVYVNPSEQFVVYEPNIKVGDSLPAKVFFEFDKDPRWIQGTPTQQPLAVKSRTLSDPYGSPRLEATIANDSIDTLSNVNLIAVVYDSSKNAVAASETVLDTIGKGEEKNAFFSWPSPLLLRPAPGSCTAPTDIMLVFDRSGSMDNEKNPPQPLTDAKNAAQTFIDKVGSIDKVGLVSFATAASDPIDQELSSDLNLVKKAVNSISIDQNSESSQHTNLGDAIEKAFNELSSSRHDSKAKRAMVILTDGDSNRPKNPADPNDEHYPEVYANEKAKQARDSNIGIYTIGLGSSINEPFLKEIAGNPDHYYKAATSPDLEAIYKQVAQDVCKEETFTTDIIAHLNHMGIQQK